MAEAVGLVLAVLGAFNDAVQCFDYIEIARNFDRDFQTATLKLDVARLRLSRWGLITGTRDAQKAKEILDHIVVLFADAEKTSRRLTSKNVGHYDEKDLDVATSSLHTKLQKLSLARFQPRKLAHRIKWALYQEKHLGRLIEDITDHVNNLVDLFPAVKSVQEHLCLDEGKELAANEHASLLAPHH